jgi:IS30 family transposase
VDRFKTLDTGLEILSYERVAVPLVLNFCFARSYSSSGRGINKDTNRLIGHYFPKGTTLNKVTWTRIELIIGRLNNRPTKSRGSKSISELFKGL